MPTRSAPRSPQRRSLATRDRLVESALHEFAERGFAGASTRTIAARAGVAQSALPYHFKTKEALWRAAADHIFGLFQAQFRARLAGLEGVDVLARMRLVLRDFVLFASAHPELHRFMLQEGTGHSARLEWLVSAHVGPIVAWFRSAVAELEASGRSIPARADHLLYALIGAASAPYALAPEFRLTSGVDPFEQEMIEAHAEGILALFLPDDVRTHPATPEDPR